MMPHVCRSLRSLSLKNSCLWNKRHVSSGIPALFCSSVRGPRSIPIPVFDYLTEQHHFSSEVATKVSQSVTYIKNPEKSDSVMSFLKQRGFSNAHIEDVVKRCPGVLSADLENTLKPKIKIFEDYGFSSEDIAVILSAHPHILTTSTKRIASSIELLADVLGSIADVTKLVRLHTWFLRFDLEQTMVPSIEYMKICGISLPQIVRYLFSYPRLFLHKPERIEYLVKKADEMGSDRESKRFLTAIRVLGSMSDGTWDKKLQLFRDLRFTDHDIQYMFQKLPQVFALSEKKIRNSIKMLLSMDNNDISYIVKNHRLLLCSIEGVLKPRLAVLEILERKNVIKRKSGLATFFKISEKRFLEKYVFPYSDVVGGVYMNRRI